MLRSATLCCILTFISFSSALELSQKWVVKKILGDSLEYQHIQAQKKAIKKISSSALAFLDWSVFLESKFQQRFHTPLQFFDTPESKAFSAITGLRKKILTGTEFKIQYNYLQEDKKFTPEFSKISSTPSATWRNSLSFHLEQDLWRNIFGVEDKLKLKIATAQQSIENIKLQEETENLLLKALELFWNSYISFVSLNASQSKKKDYGRLLSVIRQKNRYGRTRPGQLSQIQAEWEQAKQEWILQKRNYEDNLDRLFNITFKSLDLEKRKNFDLTFKVRQKVSPPLELKADPSFEPRKVLLAKKSLFIQESKKNMQKFLSRPSLKLSGSYTFAGYNTDLDSSLEDFRDNKNRNYFIGLNLNYPFSGLEERKKKMDYYRSEVYAGELNLEISKKQFHQMVNSSRRGLSALYQALLSVKKIHFLRQKSYREIRKAFLDGRLSVFDLIRAKELSLFSEIAKARLKSQYYQALAYDYAMRDQLSALYTSN